MKKIIFMGFISIFALASCSQNTSSDLNKNTKFPPNEKNHDFNSHDDDSQKCFKNDELVPCQNKIKNEGFNRYRVNI